MNMRDVVFGSYKKFQGWIIFCCVLCLLVGFVVGLLLPIPRVASTPKAVSVAQAAPAALVEQLDGPFTVDSIGFFDSLKSNAWMLTHYRETGTWRIMVFVNDHVDITYEEKSFDALVKDLKETRWPER